MKLEGDLELELELEEVQEKEPEVFEVDPEPDLDPEVVEVEVKVSGPQAFDTRLLNEALPTWPILILCLCAGLGWNNA